MRKLPGESGRLLREKVTSELVPKDVFTKRIRSEILALQSEYTSLIYISASQAWRL